MRSRALLFLFALVPLACAQSRFPANNAIAVNPDTHLVLTFPTPPTLGQSGQIRILDAATHQVVDTLDLSIPAGPDPTHRITVPNAQSIDPNPPTPTTTTPAVLTTPSDLHHYQLNTIGGLADFHFYPVILHGNTATIYLHTNVLRYGHHYSVEIDPSVLPGLNKDPWTFTTKASPPSPAATRLTVAADGTGDFNTIQGAADFVPANPPRRITIFIRNGTYEEIVFFQKKSNLTFRGEDRDKVQVGYGNNSAFNPPMPGPSRRCAFSVYDSNGIELANFSVSNYFSGQAEGLLIFGSKNIATNLNIKGSGDALNLRGSVYLTDSRIIGDGDTILGVGPAFFNHCEIQSMGPFMWIRNTQANHGNVFLNSTFIARERTTPLPPPPAGTTRPPSLGSVLVRLPNNHGLNYPYAEAILLNCHLKGIPAIGWGPLEDDTTHMHLWEYNSTTLNGQPIDTTQRNPVSRQLKQPADAKLIADYSNPAFVLDGWTPTPSIASGFQR